MHRLFEWSRCRSTGLINIVYNSAARSLNLSSPEAGGWVTVSRKALTFSVSAWASILFTSYLISLLVITQITIRSSNAAYSTIGAVAGILAWISVGKSEEVTNGSLIST